MSALAPLSPANTNPKTKTATPTQTPSGRYGAGTSPAVPTETPTSNVPTTETLMTMPQTPQSVWTAFLNSIIGGGLGNPRANTAAGRYGTGTSPAIPSGNYTLPPQPGSWAYMAANPQTWVKSPYPANMPRAEQRADELKVSAAIRAPKVLQYLLPDALPPDVPYQGGYDQYQYPQYPSPQYPSYPYPVYQNGGGGGYAQDPYAWMSKLLNWNVNK